MSQPPELPPRETLGLSRPDERLSSRPVPDLSGAGADLLPRLSDAAEAGREPREPAGESAKSGGTGGDGLGPRAAPALAPWWVRGLYIVAGLLLVGLGLLGAYLPLLPTTPFLLLATYFLARSWPALNDRVQRVPIFGRYLREWEQHRGVRREVKWLASGVCMVTVGLGLWWGPPLPWLQGAILALVGVGLAVVWRLPTIR